MDYQLLVLRHEIIIKQNKGIVLKVGYIIIKQKTGSFLFFIYLLHEAIEADILYQPIWFYLFI